MSDSVLRELERRWAATGSVEHEVTLLRERVRLGRLTVERVAMAAALGREAARALAVAPAHLDDESWVWDAATLLTLQERAVFAAGCAGRAVGVWRAALPDDERPLLALALLEDWIWNRTPFDAAYVSDTLEDVVAEQARELAGRGDERAGRVASAGRAVIDALLIAAEGAEPSEDTVLCAATKARTALGGVEEPTQREQMARLLLHGPDLLRPFTTTADHE